MSNPDRAVQNLRNHLEEALANAEYRGADRERVAALLEEYAEAVRNGHPRPPERRGRWWQEVHGEDNGDE